MLLASRLDGLHTYARPKSVIYGNSSLVYAVCIVLMSLKTYILLVGHPGVSWDLRARRALVAVRSPGGLFGTRGLFLGPPLIFENRSFRVRARLTFALRADSLERLGALFPSLASVPELDVGFP